MGQNAVVEEAEAAVSEAETRGIVPRRAEDRALLGRVGVLERQLAIAINERSAIAREMAGAKRAAQVCHGELGAEIAGLRLALTQMAGLLSMLSEVVADEADTAVKGALYVAGAAAKEIVKSI